MFDVPRIKRCETRPYSFGSLDPEKPFVLHTRPLQQSRNELVLRFSLRESPMTKEVEAALEKTRIAREACAKAQGKKDDLNVALALALQSHEVALDQRAMEILAHCCVASWDDVTETVVVDDAKRSQPVECTPENVLRFLRFMYTPAEQGGAGRADDVHAYIHWASRDTTFTELLKDGETLGKE